VSSVHTTTLERPLGSERTPAGGVVADPWLRTAVVVPAARCGRSGVGDGGWVAGTVAGHLGRGPVEVTFHSPAPLDVPLELRAADDRASLAMSPGPSGPSVPPAMSTLTGTAAGSEVGRLLASARRVGVRLRAPAPVTWDEARAAEGRFAGHGDHPDPGCYVCGAGRAPGDGLRLFAGPVPGRPGTVAATCVPLPDQANPIGVWALLGCPTGPVAHEPGRRAARLGRLTGHVLGPVRSGERHVVVAERAAGDGRRVHVRVAVYPAPALALAPALGPAGSGRPVAVGLATWVRVS
jgi:hypothetical protein